MYGYKVIDCEKVINIKHNAMLSKFQLNRINSWEREARLSCVQMEDSVIINSFATYLPISWVAHLFCPFAWVLKPRCTLHFTQLYSYCCSLSVHCLPSLCSVYCDLSLQISTGRLFPLWSLSSSLDKVTFLVCIQKIMNNSLTA